MPSESELDKLFRERYWAAQHRHVAAALLYRTGLQIDRTRHALEHAKRLVDRLRNREESPSSPIANLNDDLPRLTTRTRHR